MLLYTRSKTRLVINDNVIFICNLYVVDVVSKTAIYDYLYCTFVTQVLVTVLKYVRYPKHLGICLGKILAVYMHWLCKLCRRQDCGH